MGTIALGVVTAGLWFLAIPFYPKRCSICKSAAVYARAPDAVRSSGDQPVEDRIAELERRLSLTEGELEVATVEIERLRAEQDFYRKLLDDPTTRKGRSNTA